MRGVRNRGWQYAPYDVDPKIGHWADPAFKEDFVYRCLKIVDEFCPGFSSSVIGYDALSPLDLERVFGMHKGSIHHGGTTLLLVCVCVCVCMCDRNFVKL